MKLTIKNPASFCKEAPIVGYYLLSVTTTRSDYTFRLNPHSGGDKLIVTLNRESDNRKAMGYDGKLQIEPGYSVGVTIGRKLMGNYFTYEQIRERRPLTDWINRMVKR